MTTNAESTKGYVLVWLVLLALTAISFAGSTLHLGAYEAVLALAIASVKTGFVVMVFMHLRDAPFSTAIMPALAVVLMVTFVGLTVADVATRHTFPIGPASPSEVRRDRP